MLRINPSDLIVFSKKEGEQEITGTVDICCIARESITYKVSFFLNQYFVTDWVWLGVISDVTVFRYGSLLISFFRR